VTSAAREAGVARETVHRGSHDPAFQAALNETRADLRSAGRRRLLATAEEATTVVAEPVRQGDVKVALAVLRGLGHLGGSTPAVGLTDVSKLAEEKRLSKAEADERRFMRSILTGNR
jgi:hypothetical protein